MSQSTTDFFTSMPKSRQHILSLVILFIVPFVLFFDITLGGKELERHDITQWRAGAESIIEYREEFGKEPLWAENMFGGMPAYVVSVKKQVPHLDYLSRLFQGIYPAFQFWVMLSGMYFLLVLMGFRPLSSVFGSLLYSLTTYFPVIIMAGHTSKFFALGIIPWVIAGYWMLTRSDKKLPGLLLFMVSMTLEVRAGHPQITYYFMYLLGFLWLFDSWNAFKKNDLKNWGIVTAMLLIGGIVGILGNAERFLTLQEYAEYSIRGGSAIQGTEGLNESYAFAWSQGISETLTLLVPDLFGGASPDYWGPKSVTSGPHYLGIMALLFILIALFKVRKKVMYVFFGTGTLAIFFAWGNNFELLNHFAFNYIPMFSKFRAPETWLVLTSFSYSVVAVYGLNWLLTNYHEKSVSLKSFYSPFGIVLAILISLFVFTKSTDYINPVEIDRISAQIAQQNQVSPQNPQVRQQARNYVKTRLVPEREEKANADVLRAGFFIVISGALVFLLISEKLNATATVALIVLATGIDLVSVDKRYINEEKFVAGNVDTERYILSQKRDIDTYIVDNIHSDEAYPYRVLPLLDGAFSNAVPSYFYPSLGGYTGAKLSTVQDVLMADGNPLFAGPMGINLDLLALLNTKYITYGQGLNLPGITPVFQSQSGVVYELNNVLPKAFFVDSLITAQNSVEAYEYLYPGKTDLSSTAIVEDYEGSTSADSTASVEVTNYTGAEMSFKVSRKNPGFLVISEMYYPAGWKAYLDGAETPIYKTDYLLRGVEIPAGDHELELRFEPASYKIGSMIAWGSFSIQVLLTIYLITGLFLKKK